MCLARIFAYARQLWSELGYLRRSFILLLGAKLKNIHKNSFLGCWNSISGKDQLGVIFREPASDYLELAE